MIKVTKFDGREIYLNAEHILQVEATPDTVITLTVGDSLLVKENPEEVIERIIDYRQRVNQPIPPIKVGTTYVGQDIIDDDESEGVVDYLRRIGKPFEKEVKE